MRILFSLGFILTVLLSQAQVSHMAWDDLVKKHVAPNGDVNYKGFKADEKHLDAYLDMLANNAPQSSWGKAEIMAYWINAYNAYTVKLICKHYPVESIKDLGGMIYQVNTTWDIDFIEIGGEKMNLNNIEHDKLRGQFKDARIHFAVNCASISCPRLRNEAFVASKLENQLNDQARYFVNNSIKNQIKGKDKVYISKLFSWYSGDFTRDGKTIREYINQYAQSPIPASAAIDYLEYNWKLNEKKN
ncbi:DUF547 domain-containing protein [bacterium SCSIO 12741]|nr:DUF547 domain-containing protein [bacterium SCSIO 12741]